MAESRSGAATAIVAVVALISLVAIVWFVFLRGDVAPAGGGVDVDVDLGGAAEAVTPE